MVAHADWDQRERTEPLSVEAVTDIVAARLQEQGLFTVRSGQNQLGYIDTDRSSLYLITIQHAEFAVNE